MDKSTATDVAESDQNLRDDPELARSPSDKDLDLLRPSTRYFSVHKGKGKDVEEYRKVKYALITDVEDFQPGLYDKPLPCFGCGVGWFCFLVGIMCPFMWYYATLLYFGNYYQKDPRERAGLAASAIAALCCTVTGLIILLVTLF